MVYYFHTIYAHDDLKFLVHIHPHYKFYRGSSLRENDILIIAVYLNLTAMAEFINLMMIFAKDKNQYLSIFKKKFLYINENYNEDRHRKEYIFHKDLKPYFERKNSKILLYNSWETRDLYKCIPVIVHYCKYHKIPFQKFIISMTDHQHIFKIYPCPRILSYDWQYIHAKKNFSREKLVKTDVPKKKHIIFMNARCNDERLCMAAYLFTYYREKCHISFLMNARSGPITSKMLNLSQHFLSKSQTDVFRNHLPLSLDTTHKTMSYLDFLQGSYIMLIFETNIVRSGCQQISEKTYRPILAGIPFILWSYQGGILAHLHKLGFKTFSPFINEEYDNPKKNYLDRYKCLINEVKRICSLENDKIIELYSSCLPIVKHNFTILEGRDNIPRIL